MRTWARRSCWMSLGVAASLVVVFLSIGGLQIVRVLRGPRLPAPPAHPSPASDLAYLRQTVLANENATAGELASFARVLDGARAVQSVDDVSLVASLALAELDNAHSTLSEPVMHRLPIRVHWLEDGLIVVKARPEVARLLGREIVAINGVAPSELASRASRLVGGGTPCWARYRSEYFLTAPIALRFLGADGVDGGGVADGDQHALLRTIDRQGVLADDRLRTDPDAVPCSAFWDWRESLPGDTHCGTEGWRTLLAPGADLPLYQQDPTKLYLLREVPEHDACYVRMNGSVNSKEETASAFVARVSAALRASGRHNAIVDLRYDWGGGYDLSLPLARAVARDTPRNGRIYLIVGPNTFSAGLITASQLPLYAPGRVTIVGSDVGDRLRFRAEGSLVTMPWSRAEAYVTTAWDDVGNTCGWFDDCWPPNKLVLRGVGSFSPTIRAGNTWESYIERRDLVIEAIYRDIARRQGS